MRIDITLRITPGMIRDAQGNERKALSGHLGTHFDVMDKEFPLDY
ncbi:MAG: cyclase, partial [Solobacterium sp.]|nr:cyclase [Solobacterium sp.]